MPKSMSKKGQSIDAGMKILEKRKSNARLAIYLKFNATKASVNTEEDN